MRCRPCGAALSAVAVLLVSAASARADVVVPDDQIVQGNLCAGPDCVDGEAFGFDSVRVKGPVLRFGFADTSVSAGFPSNDWELTVNDADGGGTGSYFAVRDVTAGTTPLRVVAGAPTDAVRLNADGSVRLSSGALLQRVDATTTENAAAVDGDAVLTALAALPISTFEYVADAANTRHMGPVAGDFNSAFGVGTGTADLAPADMAAVALAAAKELDARVGELAGPRGATGPAGAAGATGAEGPRGPAGKDAACPDTFPAALRVLRTLERTQAVLRRRNSTLRQRVRTLERAVRARAGS